MLLAACVTMSREVFASSTASSSTSLITCVTMSLERRHKYCQVSTLIIFCEREDRERGCVSVYYIYIETEGERERARERERVARILCVSRCVCVCVCV